jgi:nickel/cobalt transporter (NicO) family protein
MKQYRLACCLVGIAAAVLLLAGAAAQAKSPFGIATPDSTGSGFGGPLGPFFVWVALRQAEFYKALTSALTDIKANGWAAWLFLGLSFAYGVFHAVGPGHGKAVISAYLVSSGETVKRGIALSFTAAFVQALTAVVVVGVLAIVLRATAMTMTAATDWFEIASYALVAAVGAWLLWSKAFGGGHHHHHHHVNPGSNHHEDHDGDHGHDHDHASGGANDHEGHCDHGHVHAPAPALDVARTPVARVWSTIMAVGIRPCSGAIIVLVFALSQGLFLAGIAATFVMALGTGLTVAAIATLAVSARGVAVRIAGVDSPLTARLVKVAEIAAAAAILLLGLTLLGGALVNGLPT